MSTSEQTSLAPPADWLAGARQRQTELSPVFLLGMTLVGAVLRLWQFSGQSLWVDEILSWQAIRPEAGLSFWAQFLDTIQGPLYLAVTWPLTRSHDPAVMLRWPAVVAGIVAVPVFGWLAFRLLDGRAARLALFLFAINPFHIWYSQEGRGYAFLVLFSLVVALCYLAMVRRGPSGRLVLAFVLAGVALVLSNLSGVFLLVSMGLSLLVWERPQRRSAWLWWLGAFALVLVVVAPWLLRAGGIWAVDRIVPGAATGADLRGASTFSVAAIPYAVFTFFFGFSLGPSLRELHQPDRLAVVMAYWPLLGSGLVGVTVAVASGLFRPSRRTLVLLSWAVVPVVLAAILAARNIKPWNPRYVMVALPWLLLLAAKGLARLPRQFGGALALLVVGLTLWSLAGYFGQTKYAKADVRGAVAWADSLTPEGGAVLVPVVTGVFEFYDQDRHRLLDSYGAPPLASPAEAEQYCRAKLAGVPSCLVVLAREWYFDPEGFLLPALAGLGELEPAGELPGVQLLKWRGPVDQSSRPNAGTSDEL